MKESFMKTDVSLKRWQLYLLRFALLLFTWTALDLAVLALLADGSIRHFVFPVFAVGIGIAIVALTAVYGVETNSRRAKISIAVVLGTLAVLFVTLKIIDSLAWH